MSDWTQYGDGSYAVLSFEDPPFVAAEPIPQAEDAEVSATKEAEELAAELGVDLSQVQGSGKNGRITKGDVQAAAG